MKYYKVKLVEIGPNKLQVIKAIVNHTYFGLKSAKVLSERTPVTLCMTTYRTTARNLAKALREAGAEIKSTIQTP